MQFPFPAKNIEVETKNNQNRKMGIILVKKAGHTGKKRSQST